MQRLPVHGAWVVLLILVGILYLFGLNSPYAPTNGDEMVYIHIARMTAESGHWLPLQSELSHMRNTKPPLLFWQAMVAGGDWGLGQHWQLWALRLPSVIYTFLTTGFIAFFTYRISKEWRTAIIAACLYLLFFSTFRYGRVYLTSAPETFWLALPMWWLLWQGGVARWNALTYTLIGIAMGIGCLYKSFALAAPAAAALWCAVVFLQPWQGWKPQNWRMMLRPTVGIAWSTVLAVAIFGLWFALDPDPAAVWHEFVIGENGGKMSNAQGYWHNALSGEYPMWPQLLAYPINAGLLFLVVVGWMVVNIRQTAIRSESTQNPSQRILWIWLAVWLVVFTIPSQRSERYLIPAMPALAILMALQWEKLPAWSFRATLVLILPAVLIMGRVGWVTGDLGIASSIEVAMFMLVIGTGAASVIAGFWNPQWLRPATLSAVGLVYAGFGLMVQPLTHANAQYNPPIGNALQGQRVAIPNGFTGQYERFQFVLPQVRRIPYDVDGRNTGAFQPELPPEPRLRYLLKEFDAVVWYQNNNNETEPPCKPQCTVLGSRWHIKSRHKSGEVTFSNIWHPQEWLFRREWLIEPKYD